jgi:hypothetical protein
MGKRERTAAFLLANEEITRSFFPFFPFPFFPSYTDRFASVRCLITSFSFEMDVFLLQTNIKRRRRPAEEIKHL